MQQFIGGFAVNLAMNAGTKFLEPELRATGYLGNRRRPNLYLDAATCVGLYHKGYFNRTGLKDYTDILGYDLGDITWNQIKYTKMMEGHDYNNPFLVINPDHIQGRGTAFGALVMSCGFTPTNDEAMVMRNRGLISQSMFDFVVSRNCGHATEWKAVYNNLRFVIPSISDLISFSVREAFNTEIITQFGYNKELPIEILPWLEKQGLGGKSGFAMPPGSTTNLGPDGRTEAQWFDHYWWSHWQLPSLSAGYDMLHRLYDDSRYGPSPFVIGINGQVDKDLVFLQPQLDLLLKSQDYPPYWRKRLTAMSYLPLTRTDVKRMRQVGTFKDARETYHAYRAIGYDDRNAELLAQFTEELVKPKNRKISAQAAKRICELRNSRIITRNTALLNLLELGYNRNDANMFLNTCEFDREYNEINAYIKAIRKQYLTGKLNRDKVDQAIRQVIHADDDVKELIARWDRMLNIKYRALTVSELKKAFKNNALTYNEFKDRMINLGYLESDFLIIYDTVLKDIDEEMENEVRRSLSFFTPKKLNQLFDAGILDREDIRGILLGKGWAKIAIDSFFLENQL